MKTVFRKKDFQLKSELKVPGAHLYAGIGHDVMSLVPKAAELVLKCIQEGEDIRYRGPSEIQRAFADGRCAYVLDDRGEMIGFVFFNVFFADDSRKRSCMANTTLAVDEAFRGLGIGRALKNAVTQISNAKYPTLDMISLTTNPAVIHMNRKIGFREISNQELLEIYNIDIVQECANRPNLYWRYKIDLVKGNHFLDNIEVINTKSSAILLNMVFERNKKLLTIS